MDLLAKLPEFDDKALENLLVNAQRLESLGTKAQQEQAAELIEPLNEEIEKRRLAALAASRAKREATKAAKAAA